MSNRPMVRSSSRSFHRRRLPNSQSQVTLRLAMKINGALESIHEWALIIVVATYAANAAIGDEGATKVYENHLTPISNPKPLLADFPEFVQPVIELTHFEAPILVDDKNGDLDVRAWRFSYNARGIIEMP